MPPPCIRLSLHLSLHCHLSPCLFHASYPESCCITSCHAAASHLPVPPPLIAPPFLIVPPSRHLSGWLLCCLLSRCRLLSACASTSHCTSASHHTPLAPLIRLVVVSPLIMPPPPVRPCLRLSLHHRLSPCPSHTSCPAGCCITFYHAVASRPPAPLPLIVPISRFLFGWLSCHLLSRRRCLWSTCVSPSHSTAASHCTPIAPLVWPVVASPLVMPPPPVDLRFCLSLHCPAGFCVTSHHATPSGLPAPPPLIVLLPLIAPLLCLLSCWLLRHLLPCCHLPSAWASASHRTPLAPLTRLVVASPLATPPPHVCLRLHLSAHRHLSLCPPCASCLAGCCIASHHTNYSRLLASPTLVPVSPLVAPVSCILSTLAGCCVASPYDST
jgi:hypothetical protein